LAPGRASEFGDPPGNLLRRVVMEGLVTLPAGSRLAPIGCDAGGRRVLESEPILRLEWEKQPVVTIEETIAILGVS